jgi:hypothetical protein
MSRGIFNSNNKTTEVFTFKTNSDSGTTFTPQINFLPSDRRSHVDYGDGSVGYDAGETFNHTYSDGGLVKDVKFYGNSFNDVWFIGLGGDNVYGELDLSQFPNCTYFTISNNTSTNPLLSAITHTFSDSVITDYYCYYSNLTGNHDLSMFPNLGGEIRLNTNPNLTGVTHTYSPQEFTRYDLWGCDIIGNHDLSMFPNFGGVFNMANNASLTGITHTGSTQVFTRYQVSNCDITGNHDLSMFPNLGGIFNMIINPNLTGITHTGSTQVFTTYSLSNCDITGNHDLSMFPNLGGGLSFQNNFNLTGITHTGSSQIVTFYSVQNCDITGTHDLTMFPNLGSVFVAENNDNLIEVLHTASTQTFILYQIGSNNSLLNVDISMLSGLGGRVRMPSCSSLTGVTFPQSTETFWNSATNEDNRAFYMFNMPSVGYIDFKPLSGATMDSSHVNGCTIDIRSHGMTSGEVNRTLVDFEWITTNNPTGWSGVTLDISSNSVPDTTSDGYNGISALSTLTGATYQWTITTD